MLLVVNVQAAGEKELISCNLKTALPHAMVIEMVMKHLDERYVFDKNQLSTHRRMSEYIYVPGLYDTLTEAYDRNELPDKEFR